MQEIPPVKRSSGRISNNFPIRFRTSSNSNSNTGVAEKIKSSSSSTEPLNPGILKKPQEKLTFKSNEKLKTKKTGSVSAALSPRRTSSGVVKPIEKLKTKKTATVTPSAWALSSGRKHSNFPIPNSVDSSNRTTSRTTRVRHVSNRSSKLPVAKSRPTSGRSTSIPTSVSNFSDCPSNLLVPNSPTNSGGTTPLPRSVSNYSICSSYLPVTNSPTNSGGTTSLPRSVSSYSICSSYLPVTNSPTNSGGTTPLPRSVSNYSICSSYLPVPNSPTCSGRATPKTVSNFSICSSNFLVPKSSVSPVRSTSAIDISNRFWPKKASPVRAEALHQLRIMHTRLLQWRFVNARSESILTDNKSFAEDKILKVWSGILELRNSILEKRLKIQKLKNEIKINRIINPQVHLLNPWVEIEKKNSEAAARIGRKLSASATGLPMVNGAKADTDSVQNAMFTATGVMDSIEATIAKFISQVQEIDSLAYELVNTQKQERKALEELSKEIANFASFDGAI